MNFLERLHSGQTLLFDGAMGSMLAESGAVDGAAMANLTHGAAVRDIHRRYLEAGADCIITNTLTLNEIYMAKGNQLAQLDAALEAGTLHALAAADGRALVFGDMGPTGDLLAPYGPGNADAFYAAFCRQAEVFAKWPLDGIIIETVFSLAEAELMLKACRDAAPALPVILSMTFANAKMGGRTMMGDKAADIAARALGLGACAVGTNCGDLSPLELAEVMRAMASAGLPLIAQPNAGKPRLVEGQARYDLPPAQFAAEMLAVKEAGAVMLGGCCGTTPEHIAALVDALGHR